jgi:RNA polymerase sigma-70 factor (ECF subfamily)
MRDMQDIDDEEALVRAWAGGDPEASLRLVENHGKSMLRLALALCPRPEDAEEVVQDAFLLALRGSDTFEARRGSLRSWLLGVTANRARQLRRGAARYRNLLARLQRDP